MRSHSNPATAAILLLITQSHTLSQTHPLPHHHPHHHITSRPDTLPLITTTLSLHHKGTPYPPEQSPNTPHPAITLQ